MDWGMKNRLSQLIKPDGPLLELKTSLLSLFPFINSVFAFFLLYMLVPNRRVRFVLACVV